MRPYQGKTVRPALLAAILCWAPFSTPAGEPETLSATPITSFRGAEIGQSIGGLVFEGGLNLTANHRAFGGLSGLAFLDPDRFVMVTDQGHFVSGVLDLAGQIPAGLSDVEIAPIADASGAPLANRLARDAEAVEIVFRNGQPSAVRVGFERQTRIADYALVEGRPGGPARPVAIPDWLAAVRTNQSIESVCIAPPASPIAGSTLIITEGHSIVSGTWAATLLGEHNRGDLGLGIATGFNPTDCAFLPSGDLLVLERGFGWLGFSVQIRQVAASAVQPGATLEGDVILNASGWGVDNFEGIGVRTLTDGQVRITLVSDDNFNAIQNNLLLEFALP